MHWIAPTEKDTSTGTLADRLWDVADPFGVSPDQTERRCYV